jgi:hypothetical protein
MERKLEPWEAEGFCGNCSYNVRTRDLGGHKASVLASMSVAAHRREAHPSLFAHGKPKVGSRERRFIREAAVGAEVRRVMDRGEEGVAA